MTQHALDAPLYAAGLSLWLDGDAGTRTLRHFPTRFVGLPRAGHGRYDGLLGRDFLRDLDLHYLGPDGRFDLALRVTGAR